MSDADNNAEHLVAALIERAKELHCLWRVDEILTRLDAPIDEVFSELIEAIPPGLQHSDVCRAVVLLDEYVCTPCWRVDAPCRLSADIIVLGERVGEITVYYMDERPAADEGPFLLEERRLIDAIADRIGLYVLQRRLRADHAQWEQTVKRISSHDPEPWQVLIGFLKSTDPNLLQRITRKMINHLCWSGFAEGPRLLQDSLMEFCGPDEAGGDLNRPLEKRRISDVAQLTSRTFDAAARHLSQADIVSRMQGWINEEKSIFLVKSLENPGTGVEEMSEAIERFRSAGIDETELSMDVQISLKVALLRRFFVDSLDFINVAKHHAGVSDFYDLIRHLVYPSRSQGKLGGKGAGLFLGNLIIKNAKQHSELFSNLKTPKTWYVVSDALLDFIRHNDLDEVYNRKYMEVERVRQDYPHIIQVFKNSRFPPELIKGLAAALDDFGDSPLIVRSSSLLEDRIGAAFSGKYKSLFLANQGTKGERLAALQDAIAEVYASVFGPDPIEYRAERGLLDFREEMAILIQEVVGVRAGCYFLPAYSGVAFSNNEFRWSPRLKREDGLVRMVPGLGTRAVDRLSDDYPVLIAPGQPGLRANATSDEIIRYSPRKADVINLEHNKFESIDVAELLRECGEELPIARQLISMVDGEQIRQPSPLEPDWKSDDYVVTFEGLIKSDRMIEQMRVLLTLLSETLGTAVDLEFASDGEDLYLVQCRSQSRSAEHAPAAIPRNLPRDRIVFTANRYIANGRVPDVTHIVYVDPEGYASLESMEAMRDVGRAVGRLNALLPKRQFILIGPGRWGSRGDIRLGVSVTYSDLNNTAALLEVARRKGNYLPELSFGTHFFQDLVEAEIRYIPLYPDDPNIVFNEAFLKRATNVLGDLLPDYRHLENVLHVIDVPASSDGRILKILLNADLDEGVGLLTTPSEDESSTLSAYAAVQPALEDHWRWRLEMAEQIGARLDADRFGVRAIYVMGSTKNATAGPASDIDLIIHDAGSRPQREALRTWLRGWSEALADINHLRTGYRSEGLLDVHFVTDEDIEKQTSYAAKIGAVTDAARPLALGTWTGGKAEGD